MVNANYSSRWIESSPNRGDPESESSYESFKLTTLVAVTREEEEEETLFDDITQGIQWSNNFNVEYMSLY